MDYQCPPKIRPHLPFGRRKRHTAALLSISIVAAIGMVAVGKAPSAFACDPSGGDHCYAEAQAGGPDNYGESANINISCLYAPNDEPNFVTNELWDASGNATYWIEAGAISGYGYNNPNYFTRELFYEDSRPNGGSIHFHPVEAVNPASYPVEITWVGDNTWDVWVDGLLYQSTSQPMFSDGAITEAGTEYTFASGAGMRDVGSVSDVEWQSANGNWHDEGNSMAAVTPSGPGAYIDSISYAPSSSTFSWTGPC
jgi:hypothetical protein